LYSWHSTHYFNPKLNGISGILGILGFLSNLGISGWLGRNLTIWVFKDLGLYKREPINKLVGPKFGVQVGGQTHFYFQQLGST